MNFNFLSVVIAGINSYPFLGIVFLVSSIAKIFLLTTLILKRKNIVTLRKSFMFLCGFLITSLIHDAAWLLCVIQFWLIPEIPIPFFRTWMRFAWSVYPMQYQSMIFLVESLVYGNYKIDIKQKICIVIAGIFFLLFNVYLPIQYNNLTSFGEWLLQSIAICYSFGLLSLVSFVGIMRYSRKNKFPTILDRQLKLLIGAIIVPSWLFDALSYLPFWIPSLVSIHLNNDIALTNIATIFLTASTFYCARRIMGLRFLNSHEHVIAASYSSLEKVNFFINFKRTIKQLSHAMSVPELVHTTQLFFKESFSLPLHAVSLHVCSSNLQQLADKRKDPIFDNDNFVENYLRDASPAVLNLLRKQKVLMYDDICFTHFYEPSAVNDLILKFMDKLNVDIFLPIYDRHMIVGYVTLARSARHGILYTDVDRDQMLIFASYLSNLINLIAHQNIDILLQKHTHLEHELYQRNQELIHYKESIRSCMKSQKYSDIGIVFYRSQRFDFGNKEARDIIKINPNHALGHHLAKDLKTVVQQVTLYKAAYRIFSKDTEGHPIVLSGVPQLDTQTVLIAVFYPEASDIIKRQVDLLKNPSEWDYLLYLETTELGKRVNTLIPGSGEQLLNFKIELLKAALSTRAVLLNVPDADLFSFVQMLHTIAGRDELFTLELHHQVKDKSLGIQLFGINPLFGTVEQEPLLEKLSKKGTLFIKNIHFLDKESQDIIADFIEHGFYKPLHSSHRLSSSVRIIVSAGSENLRERVSLGTFSRTLFDALQNITVNLPALIDLPEHEITGLADGYCYQEKDRFNAVIPRTLTTVEKKNILTKPPLSLYELRLKVHHLLNKKPDMLPTSPHDASDPHKKEVEEFLRDAAQRGKLVLKDKETMARLWTIFQCQSKIGDFLGVNRSSVNRRCKEYGLE